MSRTCPTCGQVIPMPRNADRREELLRLLRSGERLHEVYLTDKPDRWCITYLAPKGNYEPFDSRTIRALVQDGRLVQSYPDCADLFRLRDGTDR